MKKLLIATLACSTAAAQAQLITYYRDSDLDTFGTASQTQQLAGPTPTGWSLYGVDCNDGNAGRNIAALELANGADDNCNGTVDELNGLPGPVMNFHTPGQFNVAVGQTLNVTITSLAAGVGQVTIAKTSGPGTFTGGGAAALSTGQFSWTPTAGDVGWHGVIFFSTYGTAFSGAQTAGLIINVNPVPEPATMIALAAGIVGLARARRRKA